MENFSEGLSTVCLLIGHTKVSLPLSIPISDSFTTLNYYSTKLPGSLLYLWRDNSFGTVSCWLNLTWDSWVSSCSNNTDVTGLAWQVLVYEKNGVKPMVALNHLKHSQPALHCCCCTHCHCQRKSFLRFYCSYHCCYYHRFSAGSGPLDGAFWTRSDH